MTRYDYAPSRPAQLAAMLLEMLANAHLRAAAAIVTVVVAVIATVVAIELHRLASLQEALTVMNARVADAAQRAARLDAIRADVAHLRRQNDELLAARTAARNDVNALVLLGNRLPADVWLTRLHGDRDGSWTIEGRAPRTFSVGATLLAAERIASGAHVRLLSLGATGSSRAAMRFSLAWERRTP